jgi:hypothetical protein
MPDPFLTSPRFSMAVIEISVHLWLFGKTRGIILDMTVYFLAALLMMGRIYTRA